MSNYFTRLFLFLVFASATYPLGIIIWANIPYSYLGANFLYRQGAYGHLNMRLKEIPNYGQVDILFVGSSRVYRGFDPRIFEKTGYKVFVLGSSSQTLLQSYILLERYLNELNPKLVVYDILPSSFAIKGVEPSVDLLANDRIDYLNLRMAWEQNDIMVWNTLIYAYLRQLAGLHDNFEERIHKTEENDTYISGGYIHKKLDYHKNINCETLGKQRWKSPLPLQVEYFDKTRLLIKESRVNIAYINMPLAHYECFENNDSILSWLVLDEKYINLNHKLDLSDSLDFYDDFHLNENGVEKLDYFLIKKLDSIKLSGYTF